MNDQIINSARARRQITYIDSRLARYPDHPAKDQMLEDRARYQVALDTAHEPGPPPDRMLNRVEALVASIRSIDASLDADPDHPNAPRLLERRAEYQTSIKNIQEYGRESMPKALEGTKIEVPTDVLEQRSE